MIDRTIICLAVLVFSSMAVEAAQVEVTQTAKCRVIDRHVPDADVAYQPGKDVVEGEPVVPADLDGGAGPITVPQKFDIEIDAPLDQSVSAGQGNPLYQPRAKIGKVTVSNLEGDTAMDINGQPLYRRPPGAPSPDCAE